MGKSFWIILSVVILAAVGLIFFGGSSDEPVSTTESSDILTVTDADHKRGLAGSDVALIEYVDFQCSACAAIFPTVDQMFKEFGDQVEFVTRNFPLISIHPNSMSAHRAAEAAAEQDSYWEMHDLLYQRQQTWESSSGATSIFTSYAKELELDLEQYQKDTQSEAALNHINEDARGGEKIGVQGTPTFFLNGELLPTPRTVEEFRAALQTALDGAASAVKAQP